MHDASNWFSVTYKKLSKKVAEKLDKRLPLPVCLPCNHSQTINTQHMNNVQLTPEAISFFQDMKNMAENNLKKYAVYGWTGEDSGAVRKMEHLLKVANEALKTA